MKKKVFRDKYYPKEIIEKEKYFTFTVDEPKEEPKKGRKKKEK